MRIKLYCGKKRIMREIILSLLLFLSFGLNAQTKGSRELEENDSLEEVKMESTPSAPSSVRSEKYKVKKTSKQEQLHVSKTRNSQVFISKNKSAGNQRLQRSPSQEQQVKMDNVVDFFDSIAPNSFEYNYYKYVSSNYDVNQIHNLKEAQKLRPNNVDVKSEVAGYQIIKGDKTNSLLSIEEVINSGKLTKEVLLYSEDILLSSPLNATLITHGFDDTYSTWYTQNKKNLRKDVRIVSLDFLQSKYYQSQLKKEGYKLPSSSVIDVKYFSEFCKINKGKNIVVSMTTPKEYFKIDAKYFFVTGVVMSYSPNGKFNFHENEKLWNSSLNKHLINKAKNEKGKQLSSNYLPMLLQMRKVKNTQGKIKEVENLDVDIDKISVQCRKYKTVQKLKSSY